MDFGQAYLSFLITKVPFLFPGLTSTQFPGFIPTRSRIARSIVILRENKVALAPYTDRVSNFYDFSDNQGWFRHCCYTITN